MVEMSGTGAKSPELKQIYLLEVGKETTEYTVTTFPVLSAKLRSLKFSLENDNQVYDGFIRECDSLDRSYPTHVIVKCDSLDTFHVPVDEFFPLDVSTLNLYCGEMYVVWNWKWGIEVQDDKSTLPVQLESTCSSDGAASGSDDPEDEALTHVVVFKCIGSNRDKRSQVVLKEVSAKLERGEVVQVKMKPEPQNPFDAKAMAFVCFISGSWERIGYVVSECLDAVHSALLGNKIVSTEFNFVKYIVHWSRSGPGWYAGIEIAKRGRWPNEVVRSSSTV